MDSAAYERAMKRLGVAIRILSASLLALVVRIAIAGLTSTIGIAAALVVALLLFSLGVWRQGRALRPDQPR
jgi:multidrug efflux pump subunit AcrB